MSSKSNKLTPEVKATVISNVSESLLNTYEMTEEEAVDAANEYWDLLNLKIGKNESVSDFQERAFFALVDRIDADIE